MFVVKFVRKQSQVSNNIGHWNFGDLEPPGVRDTIDKYD